MDKQINGRITALGVQICVVSDGTQDDFISITDIARYKSDEPKMVIQNWMRNRNTIEFLGVWEEIRVCKISGWKLLNYWLIVRCADQQFPTRNFTNDV